MFHDRYALYVDVHENKGKPSKSRMQKLFRPAISDRIFFIRITTNCNNLRRCQFCNTPPSLDFTGVRIPPKKKSTHIGRNCCVPRAEWDFATLMSFAVRTHTQQYQKSCRACQVPATMPQPDSHKFHMDLYHFSSCTPTHTKQRLPEPELSPGSPPGVQLRPDGPDGRAAVGQGERRRVRRGPGQGHPLRARNRRRLRGVPGALAHHGAR